TLDEQAISPDCYRSNFKNSGFQAQGINSRCFGAQSFSTQSFSAQGFTTQDHCRHRDYRRNAWAWNKKGGLEPEQDQVCLA
ncbi:MAG: hypothetical protein WBN08_21205, partial [Thiogranum sp.]